MFLKDKYYCVICHTSGGGIVRNYALESIIHGIQKKMKNMIFECLYCDFKDTYQAISDHELVKCSNRPVRSGLLECI